MRSKLFFLFFCFLGSISVLTAQESPTKLKYTVMGIHALRYYPFQVPADSLVEPLINDLPQSARFDYQHTSIDFIGNKYFLEDPLAYFSSVEEWVYNSIIRSYSKWLSFMRPMEDKPDNIALTFFLSQAYKERGKYLQSSDEGFFELIGRNNLVHFWNDILGDADLYQTKNDVMLLSVKSPLSLKARKKYRYYLSSMEKLDGIPCYVVAFFSKERKENAFEGYLYIAQQDSSLLKAVYTLNNAMEMNWVNDVLITQSFTKKGNTTLPAKKDFRFFIGDDIKGGLMVNRTNLYSTERLDSFPVPLTSAQLQLPGLLEEARNTRAYKNTRNILYLLMTDHILMNNRWEIGPVSQAVSYNEMEGLRLKVGGNTSTGWNDQLLLGGYAAYGTRDKRFKYRGDIAWSFLSKDRSVWEYPQSLLSFTYLSDLNIPGQDLLTTDRDFFLYSFSYSGARSMSLQRIARLKYERELFRSFSFGIGGKYLNEKSVGTIQYDKFTTSELDISLRYAPNEKFIQNRNERIYFSHGDVELVLNHRTGLEGLLGSDYSYHITRFDAYKTFSFPRHAGTMDVHLSAGKVWDRLPFSLLFVPMGNHSYVFEEQDYNLMKYFEFVTDRYVSGNVSVLFNWSPFRLFDSRNKIRTSLGAKALYGPLSDNNQPQPGPRSEMLNEGINPLGNSPYVEVNVGLANIFKIFRVEWVQRLTYLEDDSGKKKNKGSLFVTVGLGF